MDGSNEINNSSSSSFSTLPIPLQQDILRFLITNEDIKLARLVTTHWYRLVMQVRLPSYKLRNNYNTLEILKNSFHERIARLCVQNYTSLLPIYSQTRFNIPPADSLELCNGVSTENVIKLIRYYAKSCNTLILQSGSLGYLPPYSLKGCLPYENLRCLDISFFVPTPVGNGFVESYEVKERIHLIALTQFLQGVELANLQEFHINAAGYSDSWLPEDLILYTKFNKAMNAFLEKYGRQIINLCYYDLPLEVMQSFKYLCNLQKFDVIFSCFKPNGQLITLDDINPALFNDLNKLQSLELSDEVAYLISYQVISKILQHYRTTVRKFVLFAYKFTLDWIPQTYPLKLDEISFRFTAFGGLLEFNQAIISHPHPKFKSVSKLELKIDYGIIDGWVANVFDWIITNFPNLKNFNLITTSVLTLPDLHLLISGLDRLRKLSSSLSTYVRSESVLTEDAENWFTQNNGNGFIKVLPTDPKEFEVLIKRPLPNSIFD